MEYVPRDPNGNDKLEVEATFVVKEIMEINEPEVRKLFEIKIKSDMNVLHLTVILKFHSNHLQLYFSMIISIQRDKPKSAKIDPGRSLFCHIFACFGM